jgi:Heparinase II/III-like protein/Heparinase II/III N-terminus
VDTGRTSALRHIPQRALAAGGTREGLKELSGRPSGHNDQTMVRSSSSAESQPELHPVRRPLIYLSTSMRLGVGNVARVLVYRACKRAGIYRWLLPPRKAVPLGLQVGSLRDAAQPSVPWANRSVLAEADELLTGRANFFSVHGQGIGNPPNWFLNPFENKRHPHPALHWGEIADFSADAGDIKVVWEMSRFIWAPVLARAWRISGDARYLSTLQLWMEDWWLCNPPNTGPNWMCGQEISIRLINSLLALRLAGLEENVVSGLVAFVESHCRRVDLTTFYAVAQNNNHGTSEAAGLFVGGTWLARYGLGDARNRGQQWADKGRRLLESAVSRLVLPDGSFSQHSLTYHRMMLDTLSFAESWRRYVGEPPFAADFYTRAAAATRWLGVTIDPASGDGPNLGANDGAHPYRLDASAYRDFRPCLQLASLLFLCCPALKDGPWDEAGAWLGVTAEGPVQPWLKESSSAIFPDGGYVVMRNTSGAQVLLRAPTARFRPAHADALHLDLWWKGKNLLRDGGTYSYADGHTLAKVLSSVIGHNTEEFDGHDQMPRLSRFLYGAWMRVVGAPAITTTADGQSWSGSYTDVWGARQKRTVTLRSNAVSVLDQVQGFKRKAVLRWRLAPGNWSQNATGCASAMGQIKVECSVPIRRMSLESGWESRHYLEKSTVPVLEVEIAEAPAVLTTTVTLS